MWARSPLSALRARAGPVRVRPVRVVLRSPRPPTVPLRRRPAWRCRDCPSCRPGVPVRPPYVPFDQVQVCFGCHRLRTVRQLVQPYGLPPCLYAGFTSGGCRGRPGPAADRRAAPSRSSGWSRHPRLSGASCRRRAARPGRDLRAGCSDPLRPRSRRTALGPLPGGVELYLANLADLDPKWNVDGTDATTGGNIDGALDAAESDDTRLGRLRGVLSDEAADARFPRELGRCGGRSGRRTSTKPSRLSAHPPTPVDDTPRGSLELARSPAYSTRIADSPACNASRS